ncbi:MAG: hypothetical protein FH756_17465 [Firmicutes bacterium]|nr:hypothetical protein [Bacillota bacterium]
MAPPAAGLLAKALAKSFLSAVVPEPKEVIKGFLVVIATLALVVIFFAGPIAVYKHVPIASPDRVQLYIEAAKSVTESTDSPCDGGVELIDWQQMIAIDAVRLKQEFENVTKSRTESLAESFIEQDGT